jgi:hypothetical protein
MEIAVNQPSRALILGGEVSFATVNQVYSPGHKRSNFEPVERVPPRLVGGLDPFIIIGNCLEFFTAKE